VREKERKRERERKLGSECVADVIWLLAFCIAGAIDCVYAGVRERDCVCR